jgi:anti-sigma regulatory factor (Ser/Thr protein kinase)
VLAVDLEPEPTSVTHARHIVRSHLARSCPDDIVETVALLVTELVTNALLHAGTQLHLAVDVGPDQVEVRVSDGCPISPTLRHYGVGDATGRGLRMVSLLATAWGVDTHADGKTVWCELAFAGRPAPESG